MNKKHKDLEDGTSSNYNLVTISCLNQDKSDISICSLVF